MDNIHTKTTQLNFSKGEMFYPNPRKPLFQFLFCARLL